MTKLFVGGLSDDGEISAEDLRPIFEEVGVVEECDRIKNYAFVRMADEESAQEAILRLNGRVVKGRPIKVEKSESKGPRKPSHKLFIGNIGFGTTAEELKAVVEKYIPVIEADVIKNYGFVHVDVESSREKLDEVVESLNGESLGGCSIRAEISTSKVRHKPGMGGGDHCFKCGKGGHWSKECPSQRSFRGDGPDRYRDNYGGPIRRERGGYHDRGHPYQTDDRYRRNRSYGEYDEYERGTNRPGYADHSASRGMSYSGRGASYHPPGRSAQDFGRPFAKDVDQFGNPGSTGYDYEAASFRHDGYQNSMYKPKPEFSGSYQASTPFEAPGYSNRNPGYSTSSGFPPNTQPQRPNFPPYNHDMYSARQSTRGTGFGQNSYATGNGRGNYGMY